MTNRTGQFPTYIELDKRRGDDDSLSGIELFAMRKNQKSLHESVLIIHNDLQDIKEMYLNHQVQIADISRSVSEMKFVLKEYHDRQGFIRTLKRYGSLVSKPILWVSALVVAILGAMEAAKRL